MLHLQYDRFARALTKAAFDAVARWGKPIDVQAQGGRGLGCGCLVQCLVSQRDSAASCPRVGRKALQVLTDIQPEGRFDWPAIKRVIQHRFGRQTHIKDTRDKLAGWRRRDGESLGAYTADLHCYTCMGYPTFDTRAQEELALQTFTRGLLPERLREHLCLYSPRTLTDAIAEGEQVEHVLNTTSSMKCRVRWTDYGESDEEGSSHHTTTTASQRPWCGTRRLPGQFLEGCYRCGEISHIARHCPAPTPWSQAPQPPTANHFPLTTPQMRLCRLSRTHGLYLNCDLNGTPCRALVDTGSTISLVQFSSSVIWSF